MAMKTFNVGDILAAADVNEYLVNNRFAFKPSGTSRNTTTTLTNDPDLSVTADANKIYYAEFFLNFVSPTSVNFKFDVTMPSGTTFTGSMYSMTNSGTNVQVGIVVSTGPLSGVGGFHPVTTTGIDNNVRISGIIDTAGTGGAVTVRWAQDTSNGSNTTLEAGSFILLRRVA